MKKNISTRFLNEISRLQQYCTVISLVSNSEHLATVFGCSFSFLFCTMVLFFLSSWRKNISVMFSSYSFFLGTILLPRSSAPAFASKISLSLEFLLFSLSFHYFCNFFSFSLFKASFRSSF
jgi:hypothetical protein